jgi:hypothetical protein
MTSTAPPASQPAAGEPAAGSAPPGSGPPPVQRRPWRWSRPGAVAAGILLLLVVILVAVELADSGPWLPSPADHVATGPVNGRPEAQFEVLSGVASVTVRTADLGPDLYRVSTPLGSGLLPRTVDHGGRVELQLVSSGPAGASAVDIRLNDQVRWGLRLAGGATRESVDLAAGRVSGVDIVAGVTAVELTLPRPQGTVPLRLTGGASEFSLLVPTGVPAQVTAGGGAGTISLDGVVRHGVAAGTVLATGGWAAATDRYELVLSAGVAALAVDHR